MSETLAGVLIGLATSLFAGVLLIWKGEELVGKLQRLPTKWRIKLLTKVFVSASKDYPYRYLHGQVLAILAALNIVFVGLYAYTTIVLFRLRGVSEQDDGKQLIVDLMPSIDFTAFKLWAPWFSLAATVFLLYVFWGFAKNFFVESLMPYAYRDFVNIRECLIKCVSNKDYIQYSNLERACASTEDIINLMNYVNTILGETRLDVADSIISSLTDDDWPGLDVR